MSPALHSLSPQPVPQTAVPGLLWPSLPSPQGQTMLAAQFQLDHSQWWTPAQLAQRQLAQLRSLCAHAMAQVPHYRGRVAATLPALAQLPQDPQLLTWETFAQWPLLQKAELRERQAALLAVQLPREHGQVFWNATTGSTGMPVRVASSMLAQFFRSALILRQQRWHGLDFSRKYAEIKPDTERTQSPHWGASTASAYATGPACSINSGTSLEEQLDWLHAEAPAYLHAQASTLRALLLHAQAQGRLPRGIDALISFSEMLPADLRQLARDLLGARVIDLYSCGEVGPLALQCPLHDHFHAQSELVLLEVLDEQGRPCAPGETGRVVVTDLTNFAMPLIRYALGDYAQVGAPCDCGRGLPVLTRILGRERNMAVDPTGRVFWPSFPAYFWLETAPIHQVQLVQHTPGEIEVRYVMERELEESECTRLSEAMRERMRYPFAFRYTRVASITRQPKEKFEDFICLCSPQAPARAEPAAVAPAPSVAAASANEAAPAAPVMLPPVRSAVPGLLFPALPDAQAQSLINLQFQFSQSQWWPQERLREMQFRQLRELLAHAIAYVPWYRDHLAKAGLRSLDELTPQTFLRWPTLAPETLRTQEAQLTARAMPPAHGGIGQSLTSGSTGTPRRILKSAVVDHHQHALTLRKFLWWGLDPAQKLMILRPIGTAGRAPQWSPATASVFHTGELVQLPTRLSVQELAAAVHAEQPAYLQGPATLLRELLLHSPTQPPRGLQCLLPYMENMPPDLPQLAREHWGVPVYDVYSCTEFGTLTLPCPEQGASHVMSESVLLEVLRDDGTPCAPGESGRVVVSALHNFAMPLIRYELGDRATVGAPCACGRGLPVLGPLIGRTQHMLTDPQGARYFPLLPRSAQVRAIAPIRQMQYRQLAPEEVELVYAMERDLTAAEAALLLEELRAIHAYPFRFHLRRADGDLRTVAGKLDPAATT